MLPACPALYTMTTGLQRQLGDEQRGRVFELAVGAELAQQPGELFYWWERNAEVNYVYLDWGQIYAIAVNSGQKKSGKGLAAFCEQVPQALRVILTPDNFAQFSADPRAFLRNVAVWKLPRRLSCTQRGWAAASSPASSQWQNIH